MSPRRASRGPWVVWGACVATAGAFLVLELGRRGFPSARHTPLFNAGGAIAAVVFPTVGALIASRRRGNAIGWLFLGIGLSFGVSGVAGALVDTSAFRSPTWQWGAWINTWSWVFGWFGMITFLLLLFPDGRAPSPRWRIVGWAAAAAMVGQTVSGMFDATAGGTAGYRSPLPTFPNAVVNAFQFPSTLVGLAAAFASIVALVKRYRRSTGDERAQMKIFVYAALVTILFIPARAALSEHHVVLVALGLASIPVLPVAVGIAILKYRLYEIDVVINKTVVYGLLAAFITAVYVAIVVGMGSAIGQGAQPNLGLSILATGVVGLAFQPVRHRAQRFANRLVYGKRATPYQVLSEFSSRVATAAAAEEQLPRMARALAEGTGASSATVWLGADGHLRPAATWPTDQAPASPAEATLAVPVLHHGEQLGAITLVKPAGERLTPTEERLGRDLASQAGLVLRNVRLTDELRARVDELRVSRRRLVAAQDAARRRLERNIHDGAQQQLVALSVKTNLARQLVVRDPDKAAALVDGLRDETHRAMRDLDELAAGLTPTALTELGLSEALRAQSARSAVPVAIDAPAVLDLAPDVATAIYFSILEALQNAAKYAGAGGARVRLASENGAIEFEVTDDGRGFDVETTSFGTGLMGMSERLAAIGGTLEVRSAPGHGTTVAGRVPSESTVELTGVPR